MSQRDRDYSEKRDFIRMRIDRAVTLVHEDLRFSATCLDLSSTGMQIEAHSEVGMGDRVRVLIASEHSGLKGLDAEAEVVRISKLDDGRQSLGLAILSIE